MKLATTVSRLLYLADFLEKLPTKRFYYATWVGDGWKGKEDLSCGTTACALGWAATLPRFRRLGLRLRKIDDFNGEFRGEPFFDGLYESSAASKLFGISEEDAQFLFTPEHYHSLRHRYAPGTSATAKDVAKHIRRYVKDIQKENGR